MYLIQTQMRGQGAQTSPNRHEQVQWRPSEGEKLAGTSANAWEWAKSEIGHGPVMGAGAMQAEGQWEQGWQQHRVHTNEGLVQESMSNGLVRARAGVYKHKQANANGQMQTRVDKQEWEQANGSRPSRAGHQEQVNVNEGVRVWMKAGEQWWQQQQQQVPPSLPFLILI